MISEVTRTCATCPFARHLDRDRYACSATHNLHNPVTRGHWEATADCNQAIEELQGQKAEESNTDADYVMALEASLEKSETQSAQAQHFSQVAAVAPYGIEVDSIKLDSYRIWAGMTQIGTMRRTSRGWLARPDGGEKSWHSTPDDAQHAIVTAALHH